MDTRLSASLMASAIMQRAEQEGGFAAVLAKGDAEAGSILVILNEQDGGRLLMERVLQPGGQYRWQDISPPSVTDEAILQAFLDKRRGYDPDLWLIELLIPSIKQFAAGMNE